MERFTGSVAEKFAHTTEKVYSVRRRIARMLEPDTSTADQLSSATHSILVALFPRKNTEVPPQEDSSDTTDAVITETNK